MANATVCDKFWLHLGGVSKHFEVYQPKDETRYRRQSHPGLGVECKTKVGTLASGEFKNSLDRPLTYYSASKDLYSLGGFKVYGGGLIGEYGRRNRGPMPLVLPTLYLECSKKYLGANFFVLPPAQGWNDYVVVFTQFKIGF